MEIAPCLWGKATIYTVLVEPPQELTKETLLVQQWIELKTKKVLFLMSELRLRPIGFEIENRKSFNSHV